MKKLLLFLVINSPLFAQWSDFSTLTASSNLSGAMNGKISIQSGAGDPNVLSIAGTAGKDLFFNTLASPPTEFLCTVTGNPCTWQQVILSGGSFPNPSWIPSYAASKVTGLFYQTIQFNTTPATQRPTVNFINGTNVTISCADANPVTNCTISATPGAGGYTQILLNGSASGLTPRSNLNFNSPLTAADNSGAGRTDIGIQTANGSQAGSLSAADWNTFNGKQPAITTGTVDQVLDGTLALKNLVNCTGAGCVTQYSTTSHTFLAHTLVAGDIPSLSATYAILAGANTYSSGLQDFSAATMKIPTASGFTASAVSMFGYDSATGFTHLWYNGADKTVGTAAFVNTGTSGATLGLLNGNLTFGGTNNYGTPSAIVLTNATNLPLTGLQAQGNATFVGNVSGGSAIPVAVSIPQSAHVLNANANGAPGQAAAQDLSALNTAVSSGGSANAQTATYAVANTSLVNGLYLCWKPANANTGAATFSPDGLTAHTIVAVPNARALIANDLIATQMACATYDLANTQWELQNPATNLTSPRGTMSFGAGTGDIATTVLAPPASGGDDVPALQALITSLPQGAHLNFPGGQAYQINSQSTHSGILCGLYFPLGIHVHQNGSSLNTSSSLTSGGTLCLNNPGSSTYESATLYSANSIHRGDTTITLTTAGNAANFTAGHTIYIQGETIDFNDRGMNIVETADSGTGILTLAFPIGKDYTTTPKVADVQSVTATDFSFDGGTINYGKTQAVIGQQINVLAFDNMRVLSNTNVVGEPFQLNYVLNLSHRGGVVTGSIAPLVDCGKGCKNMKVDGVTLNTTPSSTGSLPNGNPVVSFIEGAEGPILTGSIVSNIGNASAAPIGADISGSFDAVVKGNTFNMGPSTTGAAIASNNGSGCATNATISNNPINSSASYAIISGGCDRDVVSGNPINATGSGQGIHVIGKATVSGNAITVPNSANGIVIEGTTAQCTTASGNLITTPTGSSTGHAVSVVDPGSQQTCDPTIMGTKGTQNFTAPISFANTAHNANRIVIGNDGTTDFNPNSSSGASFTSHAYTYTSGTLNVDFSTFTFAIVTASGANPTLSFTAPIGAAVAAPLTIQLCNDTTIRTWSTSGTAPVLNPPTIASPTAGNCTQASYNWDGTAYQQVNGSNDIPGTVRGPERSDTSTSTAGNFVQWWSTTRHTATSVENNSANVHIMPRTSQSGDQLACADLNNGAAGCSLSTPMTTAGANAMGASGTIDASGQTGSNSFKIPVVAGGTSGADGAEVYDSTGKITHVRTNGADSGVVAATTTSTNVNQLAHATAVAGVVAYSQVVTGDIANNAVTSTKEAVVNTYRQCDIPVGDTSGSALTDAQLGPQKHVCKLPAAATVVEIDVDADAGSPSVIVGRGRCTTFTTGTCSAETIVNLLSGALAVSSGFEKCSNTGGTTGLDGGTTCSSTLQNTSLNAGDWIQLVSGTAGGTAKFFVAHVIYTVN